MIKKSKNIVYHKSAGGIILHKQKLLLVKNFWHGGIIPPHGHIEKGETPLDTAKREICEETGYCNVKPIYYLGQVSYQYRIGNALHKKTEYRWLFILSSPKRSPKQTQESESLQNRWYSISGAMRYASFENTKIHIQRIEKFLNSSRGKKWLQV